MYNNITKRGNKMKKIISAVIASTMLLSTVTFAKTEYKLQMYFHPSVMNDVTGEIVTDINIKNTNFVLPEKNNGISEIELEYEYDDKVFDILTDKDGKVVIKTDDNTLIKDSGKINATAENGKIHISYASDENPIEYDGTLCRFTLIAKNVNAVWNSFDYYPIRFVENSVSLKTSKDEQYYNFECIDGKVGAYNKPTMLEQPSINKNMVFSLEKSDIQVNGEVINTDATPFMSGDMWMIPMRYFAETANMEVEWDEEKSTACAYGENKTFKVSIKDNKIYINSALWQQSKQAIETNGRTYIPLSLIQELYPNAAINTSGNEISIYIP